MEFRQAEFSTFVERHVESVLYFLWKRVEAGKAALHPPLKKHRAETKRTEIVEPVRLIQLSAVGEVFGVLCRDTACRVRRFHVIHRGREDMAPLKGELAVRSTD